MKLRLFIILLLLFFISGIPAYGMSSKKIEEAIVSSVRNYIHGNFPNWADAEVRIHFKYAEDNFSLLEAKGVDLTFKIVPSYFNYKPIGNIILPVDVFSSEGKVERIFLRAKVEIIKDAVVAYKIIKKGNILDKSDLVVSEKDISFVPSYYTNPKDLLGKETTAAVPAGSIITQAMVREKPIIAKYDKVDALLKIANLVVKAPGRAMQDGYLGKTIKVQNLVTKKYFDATVLSSKEVKVEVE